MSCFDKQRLSRMFIYPLNTLKRRNCLKSKKLWNQGRVVFFYMNELSRIVGIWVSWLGFFLLKNVPSGNLLVVSHSLTIRPFSKCCLFPICHMTKKLRQLKKKSRTLPRFKIYTQISNKNDKNQSERFVWFIFPQVGK